MTVTTLHRRVAASALAEDPLFLAPWSALSDAALLAHYRSPRGVRIVPVVDEQACAPARIEALMAGRFDFNGETHTLPDPVPWLHNPSVDVEWHILLHKFYYAVGLAQAWQRSGAARYVGRWAQLIEGWMARVPPGFIAADVTGRRVQNWLYSLQGLVFEGAGAPMEAAFFRRLLHSLHEQVEFLCANLTPKRNHRTLELLAIYLAGVALPEMKRAAHWRALALHETLANVQADLLPDGVHCELSTDYHHLALRNWLQLRQLAADHGHAVPPAMDAALQRALDFAAQVHRPDGDIPSLSDGDSRSFLELLQRGADLFAREDWRYVATAGREGTAPTERLAHFAASGYHLLRSAWAPAEGFAQAQQLVFDCGPLGEGNHGHFDALSVELSAHGRPLLVDPGRYTYSEAGPINWRVHFRHTAAHNTVCVDGRCQTRYEPKPVKEASRHAGGSVRHKITGPGPTCTLLEAATSDGFDLLHGRAVSSEYDAVHERVIAFIDQRFWIVSDRLAAPTAHGYAANFQLDAPAEGNACLEGECLHSPGLQIAWPAHDGVTRRLQPGWVSRHYGHKAPAPRLLATVNAADSALTRIDHVLRPHTGAPAALRVQQVELAPGQTALLLQPADARSHYLWLHGTAPAGQLPVPGGVFTGRWLLLTLGLDGRPVQALSHAGAELRGPLPLQCLPTRAAQS